MKSRERSTSLLHGGHPIAVIDPKHPTAHRDPAFRPYVERRAEQGIAAIIRFGQRKATILFAPAFADDMRWFGW
jgi:hypothetical protein